MEIALENAMPSYSGGLGVLAEILYARLRTSACRWWRLLLYRKGYFSQRLAEDGSQTEEPVVWRVEDFLIEEAARVTVPLENRRIELRAWRYTVKGVRGFEVPVYFLDADLPSNAEGDRALTGSLYGGDAYYRLCQEVLLGIGGVRILRALGYTDLTRYHIMKAMPPYSPSNCSAKKRKKQAAPLSAAKTSKSSPQVRFHHAHAGARRPRPLPHGVCDSRLPRSNRLFRSERFHVSRPHEAGAASGTRFPDIQEAARAGASLNMTYLALSLSTYVNGVAKLHGETSRKMFPQVHIEAITNGVHAGTWACPAFQELFDRCIPDWREDNYSLRSALALPPEEVWSSHLIAKHQLFEPSARKQACPLILTLLPSASPAAPLDTNAPI